MNEVKVVKFGGGCLRDGLCFRWAAGLVRLSLAGRTGACPAVVVSAASGVTDMLLAAIEEARRSGPSAAGRLTESIRTRHLNISFNAFRGRDTARDVDAAIDAECRGLEFFLGEAARAGGAGPALRAAAVSSGERLSAIILAGVFRDMDLRSAAVEAADIGMITDRAYDEAVIDLDTFRRNIRRRRPSLFRDGNIPVVAGYYGRTPEGEIACLGRNSSDYSAAALAAVLDAGVLEIWKDVDGFLSADPRVVGRPVPVRSLSFSEAAELSHLGARIIHPRAFVPLEGRDIKLVIRSFNDPADPGTSIGRGDEERERTVKCVASDPDVAILRVSGADSGSDPAFIGVLARALAGAGIGLKTILTSRTCLSFITDGGSVPAVRAALGDLASADGRSIDLRAGVALVGLVGDGTASKSATAARMASALDKAGIDTEMVVAGASEAAVYVIVRGDKEQPAVRAIHDEFFTAAA